MIFLGHESTGHLTNSHPRAARIHTHTHHVLFKGEETETPHTVSLLHLTEKSVHHAKILGGTARNCAFRHTSRLSLPKQK